MVFKSANKKGNKVVVTGRISSYRPVSSIIILAWPIVVEMSLHTFMWVFDTAMVMRLGAHEASAVEYGALGTI